MPEVGAVLTQRELNRALLARQGLLERATVPLPEALERFGGIQAQYAPSMYVGLWSRLAGFERSALTAALERRTVVQATLMRSTIHLVSAADFWPLAVAVRAVRRERWLRAVPDAPSRAAMAGAARTLRRALERSGTLRRTEIEELLGKQRAQGAGLWIDLVRVPPAGTWERRRADVYGLAADWLGPADVTPRAATELLVRRYLKAFGPASANDVASFTGIKVGALRPALAGLELERFRAADGTVLLDVPGGPMPDPGTPAPPAFLPTWDATLLVHARRTGVLPEEHRPKLFGVKTPASFPSFLVDGAVAGTWRYANGRIELAPFGRLAAAERRALEQEAERLAAFHA
jgi:hypothetical protein